MKYAIYSRKSKFTGKGESIENQIELCKQYIKVNNTNAKDDDMIVFEDEGFSGKNTNRPQFKLMMEEVRKENIKAIVCYRLDRISRNIGDFAQLIEELAGRQTDFVSIKEQFDTSTPMGKAMMMIASVFSQLERETIAERIRDNMMELAKTGRWLGGNTPTGYKSCELVERVTLDGKERKAFKLEIIPQEIDLVKMIFEKFIETNSLTKTETYLLQQHIKTKNDNHFSRFAIKAILHNPVYMIADETAWTFFEKAEVDIFSDKEAFNGQHGVMAYNKTMQTASKANEIRSMNEWIIAVGKHKAVISGQDWVKVQDLLHQNSSKSYRKPRSNVALLSGLLFCKNCGDYMRPKMSQRTNTEGETIYSYLCETKEKSRMQNCNSKNPNGNTLDKAICEEVKKLSGHSSEFIKQLESAKKSISGNNEEYQNKLEALRKAKQDNDNQISTLARSLGKSEGSAIYDYIAQEINKLHEENKSVQQRLTEYQGLIENHLLAEYEFDILRDMLMNFATSFDTMGIEQKRSALRVFIRRIEWDGENVHMYLMGSSDDKVEISTLADTHEIYDASTVGDVTQGLGVRFASGGSPQPKRVGSK